MDGLKPLIVSKLNQLKDLCTKNSVPIAFVSGFRSFAEQDKLYAQGRTTPGAIVTNAKGGQSLHNYGVAFDICPLKGGNFDWNAPTATWQKVAGLGKSIGLEWGGDWATFPDMTHFQLLFGYSLQDFQNNKIDWSKWGYTVPPKFIFNRDLSFGGDNPTTDVSELQKRLGVITTGFFGPLTVQAVIAYQIKNGINPHSGFVGPITRASLNK